MIFRRLPVFFLLFAASVLPGKAQGPPVRHAHFSISGYLRDDTSKQSMGGILVTLQQATGTSISTAYTGEGGDFEFNNLPNGDYVVVIGPKDYAEVREPVTIDHTSRTGMTIFLKRQAKVANLPMQLSISAHQLSVPHRAHDEFEKGMALIYLKSDYRGAITQFQLAIKDFPTYYEAYAEEGGAYYQLEEMGPAEEALQKSIDLSSGQYADAMFTLASIFNETGRPEDAETTARKGISVDSSSWRGPFELARALTSLKKTDEAEKTAQQSRDLMPDNPPVYLLLANIHIQKRDFPALKQDLDEFLRLAPNSPEADQARKTLGQAEAALNSAKEASDANGEEKSADDGDDSGPQKATSPPLDPDNSGLPSLPPPTPGN